MDSYSDDSKDVRWGSPNNNQQRPRQYHNCTGHHEHIMPLGAQHCGTYVALCSRNGEEVAKGRIQPLETGDVLEGLVLSPSERAVFIEEVLLPSQEVYEILLYNMDDCCKKIIRWPSEQVKILQCHTNYNEQSRETEFRTISPLHGRNEFCPPTFSAMDTLEEIGGNQQRRHPYYGRSTSPRIIGRSRKERLSMDSVVLDKEKILYRERCMHDIDAKDILIIRCLALGSSNYENRTT